ncbi:hypothetical protein FRC03_004803 [Tulasnella sp. 419]|nr:hypothetical protein FRC03_004803 [Tulasnella sp. 419]
MYLSSIISLAIATTATAMPLRPYDSAEPVQTHNVSRRDGALPCPKDIKTIYIEGKTLPITYLGAGQSGCVYKVEGGWNNQPAVAKTLRDPEVVISGNEIEALDSFQELYAQGKSSSRFWVVSAFHDPEIWKPITETKRWKDYFGEKDYLDLADSLSEEEVDAEVEACDDFLFGAYQRATIKYKYYRDTFGVDHGDPHWGNIRLNDDWSDAVWFDWGRATKVVDDDFDPKELQSYFAFESQYPVEDTERDDINFQGVCKSERRENGEPYFYPFLRTTEVQA